MRVGCIKPRALILGVLALAATTACGAAEECRDSRDLATLEADKSIEAIEIRAWRYYNGAGVPADRKHALELWEEAAKQGDARALARLGQPRPHAERSLLEYPTNLDRLGEAAEKHDLLAAVSLGLAYVHGQAGGAMGRKQGLMTLERAAEQGSVFACASLAIFFESAANRNASQAKLWAQRATDLAKKNEKTLGAEDITALSSMLLAGAGGQRDIPHAIEWLTTAAKLGDPVAMYLLASCYTEPQGDGEKKESVKPDYVQARQWASASVRGGYARANVLLAFLQVSGQGGEKDPEYAAELLIRPVEIGYPEAKRLMAMMYLSGQGVMRNTWRAETLLTQAADDGDMDAMWDLVKIYRDGDMGVARDKEKAALWLSRAYEKGHPEAKAMMERYKNNAASQPATRP